MTLDELREKYGNVELKEGFEYFIVKPKIGKVYSIGDLEKDQVVHYIDSGDNICEIVLNLMNPYNHAMVEQGNVFYDEKSAKEEVKRRKVYHTVEKYAYKFSKQEWKNRNIKKYYPYYLQKDEEISFYYVINKSAELNFKSEEDIQKAIDEVGEKDFIRYYLGVEL